VLVLPVLDELAVSRHEVQKRRGLSVAPHQLLYEVALRTPVFVGKEFQFLATKLTIQHDLD